MNPENNCSTEAAVQNRYRAAATHVERSLCCCSADYNPEYLKIIPQEVIEKDYGCGDPSKYLQPGETVLDLGSGAGKICFIAAQIVGREGRVIGVDMTDEMLGLARRNAPGVADKLGYANVEFRKGRIQDLALDVDLFEEQLKDKPMRGAAGYFAAEEQAARLREEHPLIATASIDTVVSNCVLNLVAPRAKKTVFHEIFRVLKPGGRAVISDIVADREVPESLQRDSGLWTGCISGALTESNLVRAFVEAGFQPIELLKRDEEPWKTIETIQFRSLTVAAHKPGVSCCSAAVSASGRRLPRPTPC